MTADRFVRAEPAGRAPVQLDESQRKATGLADDVHAAVIGAPGTGKTTTLVETVVERVLGRGWASDELLVLAPTRHSATLLRDRLAVRLGVVTLGPLARTPASFAFEIVRRAAVRAGNAPPTLLTGGDQDLLIRQLLEGHLEDDSGPDWPDHLGPEVRMLASFRTEMRELMMRATEHGIAPERLAALGRRSDRAEWVAAAEFIAEYQAVIAAHREQLDPAEMLAFAAAVVARGEDESVQRLRLVLVDDAQELTESALALLRALAANGTRVLVFGDPDVAANAFRGGEPDALGRLGAVLGSTDAQTLYLSRSYRQGPALRALTASVVQRIGTAAAGGQRAARASGEGEDRLLIAQAPTSAKQFAAIAGEFREAHLRRRVPWRRMAVIVRSGAHVASAAKWLGLCDVPTRTAGAGTALRDDRAARALLALVDCGIGRSELTEQRAVELLLSPFGGLDRLGLRRLRLALRAEEIAGGGSRPAGELLVEALAAPGRFATVDPRIGRSAARMAQMLSELREKAADRASIEELLWHAWESSGLARRWQDESRGSGITALEANRNLDGVVALFAAAKRFAERSPNHEPRLFLDQVLDSEVPEDSLAPAAHDDAVLVTTSAGVVGLEFDVVAVANVQEGVWPNLRPRGSLLGATHLVREATGLDHAELDERKLVLDDELRMFALAVSRASERVIVGAVVNDDEAGSALFSLLPPGAVALNADRTAPLSLRPLVGRLRRELVSGAPSRRDAAARALARLARERVPGADPAQWHGLLEATSVAPLYDLGDESTVVPVSPPKLERFESSPLHWFIDVVAGDSPSTAMGVGNVMHWAMETAAEATTEAVWAAANSRWGELEFEAPWVDERHRRLAKRMAATIAEYLTDFGLAGGTLVSAEGSFELPVDRAIVRGKIDRVEQLVDGRVVIVDLKTGSTVPSKAELAEHAQLGAYQLAYAEGRLDGLPSGHAPGGAKLLFVRSGRDGRPYREDHQAPFDETRLEQFRQRVRDAAQGMAAARFRGVVQIDEFKPGEEKFRWHVVRAVCSD